ncbi:MAG: hypothetical protein F6J86_30185 [Symploca sp. SIO1B1]|nr:hypothetical protein [Symploca sp. SIO1B1]
MWNWHLASHPNCYLSEITTGGQPVPLEIILQETILMWNWHLASHLNYYLSEIVTG